MEVANFDDIPPVKDNFLLTWDEKAFSEKKKSWNK